MTFRDHLTSARARLGAAGIRETEAALDAEILARHVLHWDRASFIARTADEAPAPFAADFARLIDRRARREPIAQIRGTQEFWGRDFAVSAAVLTPRPETELIIEDALGQAGPRGSAARPDRPRIADIGTGSGCLAITLALELPGAAVTATDLSESALEMARANAVRWRAAVDFRHGSLLAGHPGPFDLIVSNPPYVREPDRPGLAPEVRDFEPAAALFAGDDGLGVIRALVPAAAPALAPGGSLLMEIGYGQADDVAAIVAGCSALRLERFRDDLQGIPRVAVIRLA